MVGQGPAGLDRDTCSLYRRGQSVVADGLREVGHQQSRETIPPLMARRLSRGEARAADCQKPVAGQAKKSFDRRPRFDWTMDEHGSRRLEV
jgi:hypothetical protein